MKYSQLDAHYVGRATNVLATGMADMIQSSVTGDGVDFPKLKAGILPTAERLAKQIVEDVFREALSPNAIT
jgi:hypothetical protein